MLNAKGVGVDAVLDFDVSDSLLVSGWYLPLQLVIVQTHEN